MADSTNGQDSARPGPTALIIFGASGDLAHRKLIPALYTLDVEKRLPEQYAIIGVARSDFVVTIQRAGQAAQIFTGSFVGLNSANPPQEIGTFAY